MSSDENSKSKHLEGKNSEEDESHKEEHEEISEDENKTETKVVKSEETLEETANDDEPGTSKSVKRRKGRSKKEKPENITSEVAEEKKEEKPDEDEEDSKSDKRKGKSKKKKRSKKDEPENAEEGEEEIDDDEKAEKESIKSESKGGRGKWFKRKFRSKKHKHENTTVEESEEKNDEKLDDDNDEEEEEAKRTPSSRRKSFSERLHEKKLKLWKKSKSESTQDNVEDEVEEEEDDKTEESTQSHSRSERRDGEKKRSRLGLLVSKRFKSAKSSADTTMDSKEYNDGEGEEENGSEEEEDDESEPSEEYVEEKKRRKKKSKNKREEDDDESEPSEEYVEEKKRRKKKSKNKRVSEDDGGSEVRSEEEIPVEEKKKRKKKSKKDKVSEDDGESEVRSEEESPVEEKKKRKKKSKKNKELPRPQPRASGTNINERDEESDDDDDEKEETKSYEGETKSVDMQDSLTLDDDDDASEEKHRRRRVRKRRRKKERRQDGKENTQQQQVEGNNEVRDDEDVVTSSSVEVTRKRRKGKRMEDDENLFGVTIHGSEYLNKDFEFLVHPLVRISIVDPTTGLYLQKTKPGSDEMTYIEPVLTQKFDFTEKKSVVPRWEETLVFNKTIRDLVSGTKKAIKEESPIIFFVVREFRSMAKTRTDKRHTDLKGWRNCAWAFLKLISSTGEANIDRQCRLQLYRPPPYKKSLLDEGLDPTNDPIFQWWLQPRIPYKSTLFVTIQSIPAKHVQLGMGSDLATTPAFDAANAKQLIEASNKAQVDFDDIANSIASKTCYNIEEMRQLVRWTKHPEQNCKVPNTQLMQLWAGSHGAFTIKFSNHGYLLAVGCRHGATFPVLVYNIPFGNLCGELCGHQQLVYDIDWSQDDDEILTASGDGTAQVWKMGRGREPLCTLSHPAYVYAARFHKFAQHIVVTAGYDKIVRVWSIAKSSGRLLQELEGHTHFINTLTFDKSGLTLYTGDNGGVIMCWSTPTSVNPANEQVNWSLKKRMEDNLQNYGINKIETNPKNDRKLLLSCKNTTAKMMDTRVSGLISYEGVITDTQLIRSTMSPCGTFVISGNQNGRAYVWNTETGGQVARYNDLDFVKAVRDVDWHRHEHMLAMCSFHSNAPVYIYIYNTRVASDGVKLGKFSSAIENILEDQEKEDRLFEAKELQLSSKIDIVKEQLDNIVFGQEAAPARKKLKSVADDVTKMSSSVRAFEESLKGGTSLMPPSMLLRDAPKEQCQPRPPQFVQPSFLSPHATAGARAIGDSLKLGDLQNTSQSRFTPIGKSKNMKQDTLKNLTLSISKKGSESTDSNLVLVLYDYEANRSDELTIKRNDILKVLFRDGAKWWFGENTSGAQGYFPSSYVTTTDEKSDFGGFEISSQENVSDQNLSPRHSTPTRSITMSETKPESKLEQSTTLELSTPTASSRGRRREKRNQTNNNETMQKSVLFELPHQEQIQQELQEEPPQKEEIKQPSQQPRARPLPALVIEEKPKPRKREKTPRKKKKSKSRSPSRKDHQPIETPPKSSSPDEPRRKVPSPPKKQTNATTTTSSTEFGILKAIQEKLRQAESPERDSRSRTVDSLDDGDVIQTPLLSSTVRSRSRRKRNEQRHRSRSRNTSFDTRVQSAFNNDAFDSSEA